LDIPHGHGGLIVHCTVGTIKHELLKGEGHWVAAEEGEEANDFFGAVAAGPAEVEGVGVDEVDVGVGTEDELEFGHLVEYFFGQQRGHVAGSELEKKKENAFFFPFGPPSVLFVARRALHDLHLGFPLAPHPHPPSLKGSPTFYGISYPSIF
jgi:hypothetical protein